jgi:CRISPR-associated protein Cmr4
MFKAVKLLFLYTETPLHVGSGSSLGVVDLPIQRERHTNLPMIQSSGIKGKLRSAFENNGLKGQTDLMKAIFGPESSNASDHAGALSPGDGRILLFPVRSLKGVFAWITCPLVISRFVRDLQLSGEQPTWSDLSQVTDSTALVPENCQLSIDSAIVLEEFTFTASKDQKVTEFAAWLADHALPSGAEYDFWKDKLKTNLAIVSDDAFKDFCQFSTDIVARTKLDPVKKTVETGALWTEENLPNDTLLYTPLFACDPRVENKPKKQNGTDDLDAEEILNIVQQHLTNGHARLQLGGNETVGRGIVATRVFGKAGENQNEQK